MKLNYAKRILAVSVLTLLGVLILNVIFTHLLFATISSINNKVKQQVISAQEREQNLALKDSIINSEVERAKLATYFIGRGEAETTAFISQLESVAKRAGLVSSIKSVSYEAVAGVNTLSALRFKFIVSGKWASVFGFLQTIENLPKVVLVRGVSLNADSGSWTAEIDFAVAQSKN